MRVTILGAVFAFLAGVNVAKADVPKEHIFALACLENLEISTTWSQCVGLMFAPCAPYDVGSDDHVACLRREKANWNTTMQTLQTNVQQVITPTAAGELVKILSGWVSYVSQTCEAAGQAHSSTSVEAAELGCQITELAGLSGEYAACLEGRSNSEYCVIKQE